MIPSNSLQSQLSIDVLCFNPFTAKYPSLELIITKNIDKCPAEEKGCSARDLLKDESCRAGNLLSNDIRYDRIG